MMQLAYLADISIYSAQKNSLSGNLTSIKLLAAKQLSESTFSEDNESSSLQMSFVASCFQSVAYIPASDQEAPVLRHTNVISMNSIALVGLIATFTCSSLRSIVSYVLFFSSHCSL